MTYSLERLPPTIESTRTILEITGDDLRASGMPEAEVLEIITDEARLARIQRKLAQTSDFMGAMDDGKVIGFSQSHEWRTGDQRPYAGTLERARLRMHDGFNDSRLPVRPLGIFAINVAGSLPPDERLAVADRLIVDALERATDKYKIARVGLGEDEPFLSVFERREFRPTGQYGEPIGMSLQLYDAPIEKRR